MKPLSFKVKICGVTTPDDAQMAVRAGADAIGLNFYSGSKRFVTIEQAEAITAAIPNGATTVGVFVNSTIAEITNILKRLPLDLIQLHGDEPPEFLAEIRTKHAMPIMRAFRAERIHEYLEQCTSLNCAPDAILIDAFKPGQYGGTGETADWNAIAQWKKDWALEIPLVLAGGLTSSKVAEAIQIVKPDAVDTASGVESAPGRKDPAMVQAFVKAARGALSDNHRRP